MQSPLNIIKPGGTLRGTPLDIKNHHPHATLQSPAASTNHRLPGVEVPCNDATIETATDSTPLLPILFSTSGCQWTHKRVVI